MCPSCIAAKVARQQMIDEYVSKGMRFIVKGKRKSKPPQIFHAVVCNITRLCLYTKAEIILTIFMSTIINIQIHNHLSMDRIGSILIVQIIRKNTSQSCQTMLQICFLHQDVLQQCRRQCRSALLQCREQRTTIRTREQKSVQQRTKSCTLSICSAVASLHYKQMLLLFQWFEIGSRMFA